MSHHHSVAVLDHGGLTQGLDPSIPVLATDPVFDVLCFGTSLKDQVPLRLARQAKADGKRVVAVLDNWVNYRSRLCMDGLPPLIPDIYAVMDDKAKEEALADEVPETCLVVTGHPNLGSLDLAAQQVTDAWRLEFRQRLGLGLNGRGLIAFINEPVSQDQGAGPDNSAWRGYTEWDALSALAQGLGDAPVDVVVIPHPRDQPEQVEQAWERVKGSCAGRVVVGLSGREVMLAADRTAGMASILLYESWLVGRPTLSLQPGLVRDDLLSIALRPGVTLVRTVDQIVQKVGAWLTQPAGAPQADLIRHGGAAERIGRLCLAQT